MKLTETEHRSMQSALENLRIAGLSVYKIARQRDLKRLEKMAEAILKKHGALETEYGKIILMKVRKPRRRKEEMDGQDDA